MYVTDCPCLQFLYELCLSLDTRPSWFIYKPDLTGLEPYLTPKHMHAWSCIANMHATQAIIKIISKYIPLLNHKFSNKQTSLLLYPKIFPPFSSFHSTLDLRNICIHSCFIHVHQSYSFILSSWSLQIQIPKGITWLFI